jgi:hypothetical protein
MSTEERLEKLEYELIVTHRSNRRIMVALIILVIAWLSNALFFNTTVSAQDKDDIYPIIRTNGLILIDENGKSRAGLFMLSDGPAFGLNDENEKPLLILKAGQKRTALDLFDENVKSRVSLSINKSGAGLALADENGKPRGRVGIDNTGVNIILCDKNGTVRTVVGATQTKTPDGKTVTNPESSIILYGPDGEVAWQAPR